MNDSADTLEVLLFRLAGASDTLFAINLFKVLEIVNGHASVAPPLVKHPACSGLADIRGRVVPVLDLSQAAFGVPGRSPLWLWCDFARRQVAFEVAEVLHLARLPLAACRSPRSSRPSALPASRAMPASPACSISRTAASRHCSTPTG